MPRRLFASVMLALSLLMAPTVAGQHTPASITATVSGQHAQFETESAAQQHRPKDTVVWLNTISGIYHEKDMRWYGHTKHGAYFCQAEADTAGDRDTRNGQ